MKQIISKDVYTIVTNLIIQKLEQGIVPWEQPWFELGPPRNLITQRPYRGINYLLLQSLNYPVNEFLTFKQVQDLGGSVPKGTKGHLLTYWIWHEDKPGTLNLDVKPRSVPALRYYFVFNTSQVTGLPARSSPLSEKAKNAIETCEKIIANMPNPPKIVHAENQAYYFIDGDFINMPRRELFNSTEAYFHCLFHEEIHATGAADRLNRKELAEQKGSKDLYAIEELTAEIGANYLASYAGISSIVFDNSMAYINHWLERLKRNNRFIIYASAHAQKATDYILNIRHDENNVIDALKIEA